MTEDTVTLKFGPQRHKFDLTLPLQQQLVEEWDTMMPDIVKQLEEGTALKELAWTVLVGGLIGAGLSEDRAQAALFSIVLHGKRRDVILGAYAVAAAGLRKQVRAEWLVEVDFRATDFSDPRLNQHHDNPDWNGQMKTLTE